MSGATSSGSAKSRVQSVSKVLRVLEILADSAHGEMSVTEIAKCLEWNRTTVYRFMQTLVEEGYVRYLPATESYRLTFKLVGLANQVLNRLDIRKIVHPFLVELVKKWQINAHLGVLESDEVVFVDRIDCDKPFRTNFHIGRRAPVYATSVGKAMLALQDWGDVCRILPPSGIQRFTPNTVTDEEALRRELEQVRLIGYAVDREEHNIGVACVAAAVRDITGRAVAGISLSGLAQEVLPNVEILGPAVRETADRISAEIGWS